MTKELISRLYSSDKETRKNAVYRILFDRRHDLVPELKQAARYEEDEETGVLIAQTCLTLETFVRDYSIERQILEFLQSDAGLAEMSSKYWDYLITHGSSKMIIAVLGVMETVPPKAQDFIESCLNHLDPEIRAIACKIAIKSGRPTHFAYVLNLITDPDPMVAETAFRAVNELPPAQMNIILDYALGSPDEWVLQNVAPFLPLIITNDLRSVVAKVQYHQHPLVAKKAREALKHLDSIPFVSKRSRNKDSSVRSDENRKTSDEKEKDKFASFKEQMEQKRLQKLEEERIKREEEERIAAELEGTSEDELSEFAETLKEFEEEIQTTSGGDVKPEVEEDKPLAEDLDFENEQAVLEQVDDNVDLNKVVEEIDLVVNQAEEAGEIPDELKIGETVPTGNPEKYHEESNSAVLSDEVPDFEEISETIELNVESEEPNDNQAVKADLIADSELVTEHEKILLQKNESKEKSDDLETLQKNMTNADGVEVSDEYTSEIEVEDVDLAEIADDIDIEVVEEKPAQEAAEKTFAKDTAVKAEKPAERQPPAKEKIEEEKIPVGAIKLPPIPAAQTIVSRFPSFIADPFARFFKPALPADILVNIQQVANNLIAYLNLCFLQSCLFFAPPSEVVTRSIKECLRGHLIGPTSLRCLHNFALAMKQSRENPVFFTFSLANLISESSDSNPLLMLRELKEYLKSPVEPLEETLPQAVEGLADIIRGLKAILNNPIVMKAPKGARQPFADLSGPLAEVLPPDKRPAIELPEGEAVVLSRDGTEALGLYPYFKYSKRKLIFNKPEEKEFAVLLDRLEIDLG
ncbi:MAG: hypothetical protein Kow0029_29670 [Candidatus Rifleibacteriota bacterium]